VVPRYALSGEVDGEVSFDDERFDIDQSVTRRCRYKECPCRAVVVGAFNFESFYKYVRWILSPVAECRN
jgi:hypothetical protein